MLQWNVGHCIESVDQVYLYLCLYSAFCASYFVILFPSTQCQVVPSCSNGMWAIAWNWLTKCICICICFFVICILYFPPHDAEGMVVPLLLQWNVCHCMELVDLLYVYFAFYVFLYTIQGGALLLQWNLGFCMELVDHVCLFLYLFFPPHNARWCPPA